MIFYEPPVSPSLGGNGKLGDTPKSPGRGVNPLCTLPIKVSELSAIRELRGQPAISLLRSTGERNIIMEQKRGGMK